MPNDVKLDYASPKPSEERRERKGWGHLVVGVAAMVVPLLILVALVYMLIRFLFPFYGVR